MRQNEKNFAQQWDKMKERGDLTIDVRKQILVDLSKFITALRIKHHDIVLVIDTNEVFDPRKK